MTALVQGEATAPPSCFLLLAVSSLAPPLISRKLAHWGSALVLLSLALGLAGAKPQATLSSVASSILGKGSRIAGLSP